MPEECAYKKAIENTQNEKDKWYQRVWRPLAAKIFLLIVVFDFVVMPVFVEMTNKNRDFDQITTAISQIKDPAVQVEFMRKIEVSNRTWTPLTTLGGGLFFMSFGAILGAAAWTRGQEKTERERSRTNTEETSRMIRIEEYLERRRRRKNKNPQDDEEDVEAGPL